MNPFFLLAGIGSFIMFVSIGLSIAYRIIKANGPIISQTNIRTTKIFKQSKEVEHK